MDVVELVGPAGFVRQLLSGRGTSRVALPLKRKKVPGGAPRMEWIAEAVKKDALGWLTRAGGWRSRKVVVGGRRREGRVWDRRIFEALGVRFTSGPLRLLVAAMETRVGLPEVDSALRKVIVQGLAGDDPATGDVLALHRIVTRIISAPPPAQGRRHGAEGARCPACGEGLTVPRKGPPLTACPACAEPLTSADLDLGPARRKERAVQEVLRALSPLTLLFEPDAAGRLSKDEDVVSKRLRPLVQGDRAVLCSYLDEPLARSWLAAEGRRRAMGPQDALEAYQTTVRGLRGYVKAVTDAGRPDALRPLIAFYEGYVVRRFGGRAEVQADLARLAQGFNRASEREELLRAAGGLFSLGREVEAVVEEALDAPYVDRTEAQKVLLADYHERFRDVGPEVEAIRRELLGEIG